MVSGPKKHLKRLNAPKSWMLDKLGGTFAPRPRCGPHKLEESLPLCLVVRRKLKFAQNTREVEYIIKNKAIKVDGKVRTDKKYPTGFMDVVSIPKANQHYRVLYNVNKKFCLQNITEEESSFKLCKVVSKRLENNGILTITTNDGRTIKYINPDISIGDTIKFNLNTQEIESFYKFIPGQTVLAFRGKNMGCSGIIKSKNKHITGFTMVTVEDLNGRLFVSREKNLMVIGENGKHIITLPKEKGIKTSDFMRSNLIYGELKDENENDEESEYDSEN